MSITSKKYVYIALAMNPDKNTIFVASNNIATKFLFWIILMPHLAQVNDIALALDKTFQQSHGIAHRRFHF